MDVYRRTGGSRNDRRSLRKGRYRDGADALQGFLQPAVHRGGPEDAVQETLRRAWEKRASLKNDGYLHTWVVRILLNVCHDIQRRKRRMIPTADFPETAAPEADVPVDLRECLLRLDERERLPILLYYVEGYDTRQVAAILRIPQGTVKSRLDRGRRQLKAICGEEVFGE